MMSTSTNNATTTTAHPSLFHIFTCILVFTSTNHVMGFIVDVPHHRTNLHLTWNNKKNNNIATHSKNIQRKVQDELLVPIPVLSKDNNRRVQTSTFLYLQDDESGSGGTPAKVQRSAFGKAAIGQKKRQITMIGEKKTEERGITTLPPNMEPTSKSASKSSQSKRKWKNPNVVLSSQDPKLILLKKHIKGQKIDEEEIEILLEQRDAALLALKTHLQLPLDTSLDILNSYPSLYTSIQPNLSSKLLYLLNDINIKPKQLRRMLTSHPRLMENVLLDSEDNITNTIEVLQTELDLSLEDIKTIQSKSLPAILSYPRSELRKRILVYKHDLLYPKDEMKKMVWKDPRMLRTDSSNVRQILNVFREELGIEKEDVHQMLRKEILLLTYNAEGNIRPTIRYLKEFEVGKCLGMVERKGKSTLQASSVEEGEEIVKERLKALVMGHPKVLSSSIEKNLKPTVAFFLNECGLSEYEFGRVIYRRGGSLLEANVDRTLKRKVAFLRENLGLEINDDNDQDNDERVDVPLLETKSKLTTIEKKRLLAQMLATNPDILTLSIENNLRPKLEYFTNVIGFTRKELRYVLLKRPQLISLSLERNIIPKVEYFLEPRSESNNMDGGFGMTMDQVREWLSQYPQTLAVALDSRIKPRIKDVIGFGLFFGDDKVPMNFVTQTERNWKAFKADLTSIEEEH